MLAEAALHAVVIGCVRAAEQPAGGKQKYFTHILLGCLIRYWFPWTCANYGSNYDPTMDNGQNPTVIMCSLAACRAPVAISELPALPAVIN